MNSNLNNKEFIVEFIKNPWYKKLFDIPAEVTFIYLGGSRLYGCTDNRSDFDIVVLYTNATSVINFISTYSITWLDIHIHWYYIPMSVYINNEVPDSLLTEIGLSFIHFLTEDNIIYKNNKFSAEIDKLLVEKYNIAKRCQEDIIKRLSSFIKEIITIGHIDDAHKSKWIAVLCRIYWDLTGLPYDYGFLTKIKRIRWQSVETSVEEQAFSILKYLNNQYC